MARRSLSRCLRIGLVSLLATATTASAAVAADAQAAPGATPPASMAALGDSITRAFDACGWWHDCPAESWATGTDAAVNSQYVRIRAKNPAISGHAYNDARSGAKIADLAGQVQAAVSQRVAYVTILVGANDACTPTEAAMTPVATFEQRFRTALSALAGGLPNAEVLVLSIPDLKRLWEVGKNNFAARQVWSLAGICQSMLARPTSTAAADNARRDRVRQRVVAYNAVLARACAAYARCRFDGNAVFSYPFALSQVSAWDYFHPNKNGQAVLARLSHEAGYAW
jgi:lysophospholipase L1-like esterase